MFKTLILTSLTLSLMAAPGHAAQLYPNNYQANTFSKQITLIGQNKYKAMKNTKRHKNTQRKLAGNGGHVMDTCPGGDNACINQLKIDCDKAKGGLSTQPDGGVDCYVVGIHDQ